MLNLDHPKVMPLPPSSCWAWMGAHGGKGHGQIRRDDKIIGAHVLAWVETNGPLPDGAWVLHKCNVACCVNPDHLYLGTHADNMRDMKESGRRKNKTRGEKSGRALLTEVDVLTIRTQAGAGVPRRVLAQRYGVSKGCIQHIIERRNWSHI